MRELLDPRAFLEQPEPGARFVPRCQRDVATCTRLVEFRVRQQLAAHQLAHSLELAQLGVEPAFRALESGAGFVELTRTRAVDQLVETLFGFRKRGSAMRQARLHGPRLLARKQRTRRDMLALGHRQLDDSFVGLGDELQTISLQRAQRIARVVRAITTRGRQACAKAGGSRQRQ